MAANAGLGGQLALVAADIGTPIVLYCILCGDGVPNTLTQPQPATQDGAPTRLISLPLAVTFLAEFTSLTSSCRRPGPARCGTSHTPPDTARARPSSAFSPPAPATRRRSPDRHLGAGSTPGRPARAKGRSQRSTAGVTTSRSPRRAAPPVSALRPVSTLSRTPHRATERPLMVPRPREQPPQVQANIACDTTAERSP
jgi:hypothetical protein